MPRSPLDDVALSISQANASARHTRSADHRQLQQPARVPRELPALRAAASRERPVLAAAPPAPAGVGDGDGDGPDVSATPTVVGGDEAARALLGVRDEMLAHLASFDFSSTLEMRLDVMAAQYFSSLPPRRRALFAQSARDRFRAALDHALTRYEAAQQAARSSGVYAPDVNAARLASSTILDLGRKRSRLHLPSVCAGLLREWMMEDSLLRVGERSPSPGASARIAASASTQREQAGLDDEDEIEEAEDRGPASRPVTAPAEATLHEPPSVSAPHARAPSTEFWRMQRGGRLATDAVGDSRQGETMAMLQRLWFAERGVVTTAAAARGALAEALALNELRMVDAAAAAYIDTLSVGDHAVAASEAYALPVGDRWHRTPVAKVSAPLADSLALPIGGDGRGDSAPSVRAALSDREVPPASIATLCSGRATAGLRGFIERRGMARSSGGSAPAAVLRDKADGANGAGMMQLLLATQHARHEAVASEPAGSARPDAVALPFGGVRLAVTEVAPGVVSRVVLPRRGVLLVSQDNTPSTTEALRGAAELQLLYKAGRLDSVGYLPVVPRSLPEVPETVPAPVPGPATLSAAATAALDAPVPPPTVAVLEATDFTVLAVQRRGSVLQRLVESSVGAGSGPDKFGPPSAPPIVVAPLFRQAEVATSLVQAMGARNPVDTTDVHRYARNKARRRASASASASAGAASAAPRPTTPTSTRDRDAREERRRHGGGRNGNADDAFGARWIQGQGFGAGASVTAGASTLRASTAALLGPAEAKRLLAKVGVRDGDDLVLYRTGVLGATAAGASPSTAQDGAATARLVRTLVASRALPISPSSRTRTLGAVGAARPLPFSLERRPPTQAITLNKGLALI